MKFKGTQIAIDMYSCNGNIISNKDLVREVLERATTEYGMEKQSIYYNDDQGDGEFSYIIPCNRGHINVHVYLVLGFVAADIFTVNDTASPEKLAIFLRKEFSPDKSKITFLQRGDFGSQFDMKPHRRSQIKTIRRAKHAGEVLKKLVLKPKSL